MAVSRGLGSAVQAQRSSKSDVVVSPVFSEVTARYAQRPSRTIRGSDGMTARYRLPATCLEVESLSVRGMSDTRMGAGLGRGLEVRGSPVLNAARQSGSRARRCHAA